MEENKAKEATDFNLNSEGEKPIEKNDETNDNLSSENVHDDKSIAKLPADDQSVDEKSDTKTEEITENNSPKEEDNENDHDGDDNDDDDHDNDDDDEASMGTNQTNESRVQEDTEDERSKANKVESRTRHAPHYIDEETLQVIKQTLQETKFKAVLDDDEIVARMYKADRNADQRMRYESNSLEYEAIDQTLLYRHLYKEEEEYLVGHDFFKEIQSEAQDARKGALDKRTLNWVKRAAGLHKSHHYPNAGGRQNSKGDSEDGARPRSLLPRRYTRGMARNTRIKKKEEQIFKENLGLKCLLEVVEELEPTNGPYPVPLECVSFLSC